MRLLIVLALLFCSGASANSIDIEQLKWGGYTLKVKISNNRNFEVSRAKWFARANKHCSDLGIIVKVYQEHKDAYGDAIITDPNTGEETWELIPASIFGAFICEKPS